MNTVNATSLHATGIIKLPMGAVPPSSTDLSLELVTTGNGCGDAVSGSAWGARQPVTLPFKTSETSQEQLADLLLRHEIFQNESSSSDKVLSQFPFSQPGYLLAKDSLHFYVELHLKELGVDTKGSHRAIDGIVEKMIDAPSAFEFVKVLQGLDKKIQSGHLTPKEVIERFRFGNYTRAAVHQQGASSQAPCWKQKMEAVHHLLLSVTPPKHSVGINEHHAGNASSQQIQGAVHRGSPVPGSEDSSQWQASGGALTKEGPRKTIGNKQQTTGFWPSGAMAEEMSIVVEESERVLLPNVASPLSALSALSAFIARTGVRIRNSPIAFTVGAGTALSGTAYWIYTQNTASPPPASNAVPDVTPPAVTDVTDVTDVARERDVQQRGNGTSEREKFNHEHRPYEGYRRIDDKEKAERGQKTSEVDDLKLHPKKTAPPYTPS